MDSEAEQFRMKHAGMVARSAQGHAAKGMKIKDQEDMWVNIQHNTFKNWMNVQLRDTGIKVEDLSEDLKDGVALVTLVETLQKRRLRKVKKVLNQHQALENVTTALNAIAEDGIKLVNIGNVDIVNGNLKLILGLIWSLIMHYQIGQTKFPPKKLMLSWLKGVLPGCDVNNFTSSWNSGVNLSALIDYCKPGLFRNWKHLDASNSVQNCRRAMEIAHNEFNIPMVLEPEYLASPYLDDLSGMTYLSYFMKDGGPGHKATLDWVQKTLPEKNIKNFTTDWNDGRNLASLIKKLGGPVPGFKEMTSDPDKWESNLNVSLEGGKKLGVTPVLTASDMAKPDVEYLGPMAYLAYYQWVRPRQSPTEAIRLRCDVDNIRVNNPVRFRIDFLSKDIVVSELRVDVTGPSGPCRVEVDLGKRGAKGSFLPKQVGFYEIKVTHEGESVDGSPIKVRALPDVSKIMFSGIDPCALGSIVEVLINSNGAGGGDIDVIAMSPTGRPLRCPVKEEDGVYTATFQPDEAGEWSIGVTYDDEHIQGSPFTCHVYDPNAIKVRDLDIATLRSPGHPFTFVIDASACGWGDAKVDVTHNGTSIPSKTLEVERSLYEVTFTPLEAAKYKVYVYFNGHEVRGSPFPLYLGVAKPPERKGSKSKKKKTKNRDKEVEPIIKEYTSVVDSPMNSRFNKIFDSSNSKSFTSSNKHSNLNKSYESKLDELNTSSKTRNFFSSSVNKSSILNRSSEDILSKNYNSPLETSALLKDPAERKLQFDLSKKTVFDLTPKRISSDMYSSSLSRRTSSGIGTHSPNGLDSHSPTTNHLRNSSSIVDRSYNNDSSFLTNKNTSFSSTKDSSFNSSSIINTKKEQKFTSSRDYSSRLNSSNHETDFRSDRIRSSLSPELTRSPRSLKTFSPIQSPRESPLRQISPPANVPDSPLGLSAPLKVLMASQNGPKTSEGTSFYYSSVANMKILPSTY